MKIKKVLWFILSFGLLLTSCNKVSTIFPTSLTTSSNEIKLIINSERDLNDIVTLRFEPKNTTNKEVIWSCEENEFFTLNGSTIKAIKEGTASVKATSVENNELSANVNIKVYDPTLVKYNVLVNRNDSFIISGLDERYAEGNEVNFSIEITDTTKELDAVKINGKILNPLSNNLYTFIMPNNDVTIEVILKDNKNATSVSINPSKLELTVGNESKIIANVLPIDTTNTPTWEVREGENIISITPNGNECQIYALASGNAIVKVEYNENVFAECKVTVDNQNELVIEQIPTIIDLDISSTYTLTPTLNDNTSGTFSYSIEDNKIASITENGIITGNSYGTTKVTIVCNEYQNVSFTSTIEVVNHGNIESPITVKEALKICKETGNITLQSIYLKGKITSTISSKKFIVSDLEDENANLEVNNYTLLDDVENIAQNDIILINGLIENDNGTYKVTNNNNLVQIISNERGISKVSIENNDKVVIKVNDEATQEILIKNGETLTFNVTTIDGYYIEKVLVNDIELISLGDNNYSYKVEGNASIKVIISDSLIVREVVAKYDVKYDLGTRKTAKKLETTEELFKSLVPTTDNLITSISQMELIYGGGNGGRQETAWYVGDIIKVGTTSVNGSITFELSKEVNSIKIIGYVSDNACKIQVGDSLSLDWQDAENNDNKTTTTTCKNMVEATKEVMENKLASTIIIDFESTSSLKISTINKKVLYISSIEFMISNAN